MADVAGNQFFRGDLLSVVIEAQSASSMLIGDKIFPGVEVAYPLFQYPKIPIAQSQLLNAVASQRQPDGSFNSITRFIDKDTGNCIEYGLEERVDDTWKGLIGKFYDAEANAARNTAFNLKLAQEVRQAAALFNTANFTAVSAISAYTTANLTIVDPIQDIQNAVSTLNSNGVIPNTIVMSDTIANYVKRSTLFQNYVKPYGVSQTGAIPTNDTIVAAFASYGINALLVGVNAQNTATTRTGKTLSKIWGNTYYWVGRVMGGDPMAGGAGRTFYSPIAGGPMAMMSYRQENIKSDVVRAEQYVTEKVIDSTAGILIQTSYS